jgi:hypothetical protein
VDISAPAGASHETPINATITSTSETAAAEIPSAFVSTQNSLTADLPERYIDSHFFLEMIERSTKYMLFVP